MSSVVKPGLGFPNTNYAVLLRNAHENANRPSAMVIPKTSHTFIVEFVLNPDFLLDTDSWATNLPAFALTGSLLAPLISIDRPNISQRIMSINSYNRKYNVVVKEEKGTSNMVFHDDMASIVAALFLEHRNFYHHSSLIAGATGGQMSQSARNVFSDSLIGDHARGDIQNTPSRGIKLRKTGRRTFFESIRIYDLGGDVDSIDVDVFLYPTFISMNRDSRNYSDTGGVSTVSVTMDYSDYFTLVGKPTSEFSSVIENHLMSPPVANRTASSGHAVMGTTPPRDSSQPSENIFPTSNLKITPKPFKVSVNNRDIPKEVTDLITGTILDREFGTIGHDVINKLSTGDFNLLNLINIF